MNDLSLRALPRQLKQTIAILFDTGAAWITLWLAFSLRFEVLFWPATHQFFVFALAPLIAIPLFTYFGLYRAVIRHTGLSALQAIAKAVLVYGLVFALLIAAFRPHGIPRSVGILQPLLYLIFVAISRALVRFWLYTPRRSPGMTAAENLLIYGAGAAGIQIAHALAYAKRYRVVGFIDDDPSLQGKTINDWRVYRPQELEALIARQSVGGVLLAMPSISKARRLDIVESLRKKAIHVRSLPSLSDLASGDLSIADVRELDAEDLLGRAPVTPDWALMSQTIHNQVVLVTGAGGSIGGELSRQILAQRPLKLILLDHHEYSLYAIHRELQARLKADHRAEPRTELIALLANVRDATKMDLVCQKWQPHTVYHAAAYKHVPMVEHNVCEGVETNVFGTFNVAQAAIRSKANYFVLISTDKAVRPTNVMGASKRVAELVLQALAQGSDIAPPSTILTMVRFGNVLDSSGSVVPLFRQQIKAGGPITLTHQEVTRYFMTIPEAARLVIQAAAMARGGEVFVLDMGESVKIYDLAKRMVELSGLTVRDEDHPEGDIEIATTGLRPGEKLYEELLIGHSPQPSQHPRIMQANEAYLSQTILNAHLTQIKMDLQNNHSEGIKRTLQELVDGYSFNSVNLFNSL